MGGLEAAWRQYSVISVHSSMLLRECLGMKVIENFPAYYISEEGEVYSSHTSKILKPRANSRGYYQVCLRKNNKNHWLLLSRLVAATYLGMDLFDTRLEVDHKDGNLLDNSVTNLQVLDKETHLSKTLESKGHTRKYDKPKKEVFTAPKEELLRVLVSTGSWVQAAKHYGLSDNGLRKAYKRIFGVPSVPKIKDLTPE